MTSKEIEEKLKTLQKQYDALYQVMKADRLSPQKRSEYRDAFHKTGKEIAKLQQTLICIRADHKNGLF